MISAIVLAAGCSKRMNGQNKLTTELKNKHLINHILGTLIKSKINKIIVVGVKALPHPTNLFLFRNL